MFQVFILPQQIYPDSLLQYQEIRYPHTSIPFPKFRTSQRSCTKTSISVLTSRFFHKHPVRFKNAFNVDPKAHPPPPFPAYGHVIPLLEVGRKIHPHHDVTFAVSSYLVADLKQRELTSDIEFPIVAIPDGFNGFEGLNRQNWLDVHRLVYPAIAEFLRAVPTNQQSTVPGDEGSSSVRRTVDLVIGDNCIALALEVCHDRGVPYFFFNTAAASMTLGSLFVGADYPTLPESEDDMFAFMEVPPPGAPLPPMSEIYKKTMFDMNRTTNLVSGIMFNSVCELEEDVVRSIETFPTMKGIPLLFVGPLMPQTERVGVGQLEQQEKVEKWLDQRENLSVIYVSFGSIAVPNGEQIAAVAQALLATGKPFIWSLRSAEQRHLPSELTSQISGQFQGEESHFLILSWAPQKLILQHPATSMFVSHCGWNSTLESLAAGLPVLAWPMFADQKINAEWLMQRSTALMVEGTGLQSKRVVPADEIASLLKQVGGAELAQTPFRRAALDWKAKLDAATAVGGSSEMALRSVIEFAHKTN